MSNVLDRISPEQVVKMAELKEELTTEHGLMRDPEARKSAIIEYVKATAGLHITIKDIDQYYGFSTGSTQRYLRDLINKGYITFTRSAAVGRGVKYMYTYHAIPVPLEQRSSRKRMHPAIKVHRDETIVEANRKTAEAKVQEEAKAELVKKAIVKDVRLDYIERKVWEYLRDNDVQGMIAVNTLKGFVNSLRNPSGGNPKEAQDVQQGRIEREDEGDGEDQGITL